MGRVKIAKKSTFIDMTAMSDVTVLLLTFFMLTSTFLNMEPATVITPPSVSELKVQETNYLQVLVNPQGKVWITMHNDTSQAYSNEAMRAKLINQAAVLYNEQHPSNKVNFSQEQIAAFAKLNTFGVPMKNMGEFLDLAKEGPSGVSKMDKWLEGKFPNPKRPGQMMPTGIPIEMQSDKEHLDEFQIWMKAARMVANDEGSPLAEKIKEGTGVAIKADQNTSFEVVHMVMDNLQTINLNKFTLLTALKEGE